MTTKLSLTSTNATPSAISNIADGSITASYKNKIINGSFVVAQRGNSFSNVADYVCHVDRWHNGFDVVGGTREITRTQFNAGEEIDGCDYYLRYNHTVAGSGATYNYLETKIEYVRTLNGKTATISFWAKAAAPLTLTEVGIFQYFGSGGSAGVNTYSTATDKSVTTQWKRFSFPVAIPSVAGKTLGYGHCIHVLIGLPINTTFDFQITGVQLEEGSTATSFEHRPYPLESSMCQRYFTRLYLSLRAYTNGGTTHCQNITYPSLMRAAPTISRVSLQSSLNINTPSVYGDGRTDGCIYEISVVNAGDGYAVNDLIEFTAEL